MKRVLVGLVFIFLNAGIFCGNVKAMDDLDLINSINQARSSENLVNLSINYKLEKAAHLKLIDMQKYKYWSHNNPITGFAWWKFLYLAGVRGVAAENLARGYSTSLDVVNGWMSSNLHKLNLLSGRYSKVGIAIGQVNFENGSKEVIIAEFGE